MSKECLIVDFDNTLFDTSVSHKLRAVKGEKDWGCIFDCIPQFKLYEGWKSVFNYLKQRHIRFGIISTAKKELIERTLSYYGIECDAIVGYHLYYKKPNPKLMEMAIKKLNVHPSQVVYTGDNIVDLELAKKSGTQFIGACWDSSDDELLKEQGEVIMNPRELITYLK